MNKFCADYFINGHFLVRECRSVLVRRTVISFRVGIFQIAIRTVPSSVRLTTKLKVEKKEEKPASRQNAAREKEDAALVH